MVQFYTYIYFDPSKSNEPIYVGKGSNNRYLDHLKRKDNHPLTRRIRHMRREGVEPTIERIFVSNEHNALQLEIGLIRHFGRKHMDTGPLLNLTMGGQNPPRPHNRRGHPQTKETAIAIGNSLRGIPKSQIHRAKIRSVMQSDEIRAKRSFWNRNCIWINNGINETKILANEPIPIDYQKGRLQTTCDKCGKRLTAHNMNQHMRARHE
jgi:hypothetical protein